MDASSLQLIILPAGIIAILFAIYLARDVLARDTGTQAMQDVAGTIYEGAVAFIRRQYSTIFVLAIAGAVGVFALISAFETAEVADTDVFGVDLGWRTAVAFFVGALSSMAAGIIGMFISVKSNVRTASAARRSLVEAVQVAMRGGAVSGFLVVALSLLGVYGVFAAFGGLSGDPTSVRQAPFLIVGYGFGASFVALFAQLGGGIYTKAADVGADLVGKIEAGIPEDDPRNPAVIADLVGDNVGDCAGRGADLFESTAAENIGAMILGVGVFTIAQNAGWPNPEAWIFFPLVVGAFGLLATIVAIFFVRGNEDEDPMNMLNRGYWVTTGLSVIGLPHVGLMVDTNDSTGLVRACRRGSTSSPPASSAWRPVSRSSTSRSTTRPARTARSARSPRPPRPVRPPTSSPASRSASRRPFVPAITIGIALFASYWLGSQAGCHGRRPEVGGIFGTAVATMGMLMTAAYILAMDTSARSRTTPAASSRCQPAPRPKPAT